jgi:hypothetical protein
MDENYEGQYDRSAEEMAWDDEFKNENVSYIGPDLRRLGRLAVRLPQALLEVPAALVPDETRRHARAAVRESFLAVRSLLGAIGDGIEDMLADPAPATSSATVQGPPGTWGTGRASLDSTSSSKARRINVTGDEEGRTPSDMPGDMP